MTRRDFIKIMGYMSLISSVPSYAAFPETIYKEGRRFGKEAIRDDVLADKELRKRVIKEGTLQFIKKVDSYLATNPRIIETHSTKEYKEILYEPKCSPDVMCSLDDEFVVEQTIYYNKSLKEVYAMLQAEYITNPDTPLNIAQMDFPAKMPTKDYFPFADYDYGTRIPVPEYGEDFIYDVDEYMWYSCILWLDSHRMYITLYYYDYYFKQVGKDLHLIMIRFPSTV